MADVVWIVGRARELGDLERRLGSADATVEESWPSGDNPDVVVLVRAAGAATGAVTDALGADTQSFDDEEQARRAAVELVSSG